LPVSLSVSRSDLKGCTLITGFHGIGEAGYIATSYLVQAMEAERIGFVEVSYPPPFVSASNEGLVTPFEIYRKNNFIIVKLEFSPHRSEEAEFAKVLSSWAVRMRLRDAVLIGGLDINLKNGNHDFRVVSTRAYLPKIKRFEVPTLEQGLYVYGPLAVMLSEFEIRKFPAVAVLPYSTPMRADPAAAAIAIRNIAKVYRLRVDVTGLERDAKEIEGEIEMKLNQARRPMQRMYV